MKVSAIAQLVDAEVLCGVENIDSIEITAACGADMMSDVLAYVKDQGILITGLLNPQVVRTAEMMDMRCILFVRGKRPDKAVTDLASARGIILLTTEQTMFGACGMLYAAGIAAGTKSV